MASSENVSDYLLQFIESLGLSGSGEQHDTSSKKGTKRPAGNEKGNEHEVGVAELQPRYVTEKRKRCNPSLSQGDEYEFDMTPEQPSQPVPDKTESSKSLQSQDCDPSKHHPLPETSSKKSGKGKKTKNIRVKRAQNADSGTQTDDADRHEAGVQTEVSVASFACQYPEEPAASIAEEHSYFARPVLQLQPKCAIELPYPPPVSRIGVDVLPVFDEISAPGAMSACPNLTTEQEPETSEKEDEPESSADSSSSHSSVHPASSSSPSSQSSSPPLSSSPTKMSARKGASEVLGEEKDISPSQEEVMPSSMSEDSSSKPDEHSSSSYKPGPYSGSSSAEECDSGELQFCREKKYFVFESNLDLLLYALKCNECTFGHIDSINKTYVGSLVRVIVTCSCGSEVMQWESQPRIGRAPVGNLISAAAIVLSGNTFKTVCGLTHLMGLQFFTETVFYDIQRSLIVPVVNNYYINHSNMLAERFKDDKMWVSGDGRCDSPGYNAKYCSYTIMSMLSHEIVTFDLVQVSQASSSVGMEKVGFQNCMRKMAASGLKVEVVATDRHVGIRKVLREEHPDVDHEFDIWHLTKSVSKKLTARARFKDCEDLGPWVNSVKNHLWWCAQHCNGSYEMLLEMWTSIVHHVSNIHHWNSAQHFHSCAHEPLSEIEVRSKRWLTPGSKALKALSEIVFDKRLAKDLQHVTKACHTGNLEVFHSVLLKYCPKRLHFSYPVMQARLQLAVLDHNSNVGRGQAVVQKETTKSGPKGSKRWRYSYSKAAKEWLCRPVMDKKDYQYLWELMIDVLHMKQGTLQPQMSDAPEIPPNIAPLPRPPVAEMQAKAKSRFVKL